VPLKLGIRIDPYWVALLRLAALQSDPFANLIQVFLRQLSRFDEVEHNRCRGSSEHVAHQMAQDVTPRFFLALNGLVNMGAAIGSMRKRKRQQVTAVSNISRIGRWGAPAT